MPNTPDGSSLTGNPMVQQNADTTQYPKRQKSSRVTQQPIYLQDYVCNHACTTHWCNIVDFKALSANHHQLTKPYENHNEPKDYYEASQHPNWIEAMNKELQALKASQTWEVVDLSKGKNAIGSKWVYQIKFKSDGSLERFKARLVAKGYNIKHRIDYEETFSPVVKMKTVRCMLAIAANHKWIIHQLDINNVFLHGDLHEEVYMKMPEGIPNPNNQVCLLKKSLIWLEASLKAMAC